jgi:hypothetical protein
MKVAPGIIPPSSELFEQTNGLHSVAHLYGDHMYLVINMYVLKMDRSFSLSKELMQLL